MSTLQTYDVTKLRALHDHILVKDMNFSERFTEGGIVIPGDDRKSEGIRPRWAEVYAIGPKQTDVQIGQYVLVAHGRWTRGVKINIGDEEITIRRVDNNDILLVSDDAQFDNTFSDSESVSTDPHGIYGSMHNT